MCRHAAALRLLGQGTVIPAIPLVLKADRSFDEAGQRVLLRYYLDAGVGGIAVGVHTTQFAIRDAIHNLLEPVLSVTAEEIDAYERRTGRAVVRIAGACGPSEQAVREAELAGRLGYDAVLLSPSGLASLGEEALLERTRAVAGIMPVIGFYLQKAVGGRFLSFAYWKALAEVPNVVAVKCASFDPYSTVDLVRGIACSARADQVALYTGNDNTIVTDLLSEYSFQHEGKTISKRFVGGLLGHWAVWTHSAVMLFSTIEKARGQSQIPAELLTLAAQVTDCNQAFFDARNGFAGCIPGVHEVLRRQGLMDGIWCLDPDETLSPGQTEEIDRVYRQYPHLNDDAFVREHIEAWRR